jgi:hypothetical protein
MLLDESYFSRETIAVQPLTVLIGLTYTENHLLTELGDHAQTVAPHLARALAARIQQLAGSYNTLPMNNTEIQSYLGNWFLQLFQGNEASIHPTFSEAFPRLDQIILLTGIDVILTHGYEITKCSSNPEAATNALHKALALKIASEQLQSQTDTTQHLYDMMLLD